MDQFFCFLFGLAFGIDRPEHDRRNDRCHHHHKHHWHQKNWIHHPAGDSLVCHDQGHLTTGDHAHTDAERFLFGITTDFCTQPTSDDLAEYRYQHDNNGQQRGGQGHRVERHFQAHAREKDRGEEHIRKGLAFGVDIGGAGGVRDHQPDEEGADDVRHAEHLFCDVGIEEAERQRDDREPFPVPGGRVHPFLDQGVEELSKHRSHGKEQHNLEHHHPQPDRLVGSTGNKGEQDQSEDVVDQCGSKDRVA